MKNNPSITPRHSKAMKLAALKPSRSKKSQQPQQQQFEKDLQELLNLRLQNTILENKINLLQQTIDQTNKMMEFHAFVDQRLLQERDITMLVFIIEECFTENHDGEIIFHDPIIERESVMSRLNEQESLSSFEMESSDIQGGESSDSEK